MAPAEDKAGLGLRAIRLGGTLAVLAASVAAVGSGQAMLADRAAAVAAPEPVRPEPVTTARLVIEDGITVLRSYTGQVEPAQRSTMAFESGGTIARVLADEGDTVAAGTALAKLDTALLDAERDRLLAQRRALQAQAALARRTADRQTELRARGFASAQAVDGVTAGLDEVTARIDEVDAALAGVAIRLEKAVLRAPFDAVVAARLADDGAATGAGQPVLALVERAPPRFRVGLAPEIIDTLSPDTPAEVLLGGQTHAVTLFAVLPDLDPRTRTRTVLFQFDRAAVPAFREIGVLTLPRHLPMRAAWVPMSALDDGPRGLWRLLVVAEHDGQTVAGTETVEILHAEAERAFVRGTFRDGDTFITGGVHRIVPGQPVAPLPLPAEPVAGRWIR
ncbi:MAG TPA: efflux RND transporter periplasmic adaptor subunit [Paracoccaceae bacterium]|nr:efflux RND transporter periplasmic adaptor subunit [Paracoccaceae bacterium]